MFKYKAETFEDNRGSFLNLVKQIKLAGFDFDQIQQVNISSNVPPHVFRGIHANKLNNENKILKMLSGTIKGAIIDVNEASDTYGLVYRFVLNAKNRDLLYVPAGFANGYLTLEPGTQILYLHDKEYNPDNNITFNGYNLLDLITDLSPTSKVTMSENDANSTNALSLNLMSKSDDLCDW